MRRQRFSLRLAALCLGLFLYAAGAGLAAEHGATPPAEGSAAHGESAGHGHGAGQMKDHMWRWIDFLVMAAVVAWALKKVDAGGALTKRRENIGKLLQEATEGREAAERKLREYSEKLEKANQEVDEISAAIRREGELEKERIISEARVTAEKIREQAHRSAEQEVQRARAELRAEAARLAVELAGKKIRENIAKSDQDRLVDDYLSKVVELQ